MAAILNPDILNLAILDSAISVFPFKLTYTCQDWFPPFAQKKLHSFISDLNVMMAAILNSAMLDSDTAILPRFRHLVIFHSQIQLNGGSHLEFCHSDFCHFAQLIQSDSNLFILTLYLMIGSHLEFHPLEFGHLGFSYLSISFQSHSHLPRLVPTICIQKASLINSDSTWWWQPFWILSCWIKTLPSWILTSSYLLSDITQKHSNSTLTLTQTNSIWLKLIHSHLTWWWQPSWILPYWILPSWIQQSLYFLSKSLTLAMIGSHHLHKKLHSFILTQLGDDSHLEFCHVGFRHCHLGFRHLVIFSQIHSKTLSLHSDSESN